MNRPISVMHFKRHRQDGMGTRYDLVGWEGVKYAPLVNPLRKTGEPIVYLNRWREKKGQAPDPRKGQFILAAPPNEKGGKGRNLSSIYEPSLESPGWGFGDIGPGRPGADAIRTHRNEEAGTLDIYVYAGLGACAELLHLAGLTGPARGVSEKVEPDPSLINNVSLLAKTET